MVIKFKNINSNIIFIITFSIFLIFANKTNAGNNLSGAETVSIISTSSGIYFLGSKIKKIPDGNQPLITGHLPLEQRFQRWLGGECKIGKRNFLDDDIGGFATPIVSSVLLTGLNFNYPRDNRNKDVIQDLFLYTSGLIATKGITDITNGLLTRERPFKHILKDSPTTKARYSHSYIQHSFFSGHTSGAFYSMAFLNLRMRNIMRRQLTNSDYENWKGRSSGLLFGWATVVGLSRVHAYKHHLSDVIVGATVGVLVAELFYNFNNLSDTETGDNSPPLLNITIPF